ncbi:MAG: universal stress protein, partial [Brevundimonas sp.]
MTDARTPPATPRTLLLATDLSSRCDRALDRAASLAARWDARLIVVNVIEASRRDADDLLLMLDYGIFFEFIPLAELDKEQPRTVMLQDVVVGEQYAV